MEMKIPWACPLGMRSHVGGGGPEVVEVARHGHKGMCERRWPISPGRSRHLSHISCMFLIEARPMG